MIDDDRVGRYGVVANDFNPIHFADELARSMGLPGRIAHGMIAAGFGASCAARSLGDGWMEAGTFGVKFVAPVTIPDRVTIVSQTRDGGELGLAVRRSDGTVAVVGTASTAGTAVDGRT